MTSAEIIAELRASAPAAPDQLRARVQTIVAAPAPRRWPSVTRRRASLAFAGGLVAAALGAALVHGLASGGPGAEKAAPPTTGAYRSETQIRKSATAKVPAFDRALGGAAASPAPKATALKRLAPTQLPPAGLRLQDYDVSLGVQVKDPDALSKATVQAMRWARALGGFVEHVSYATPGGRKGAADLELRVPVTKVQVALQKLSSLGRLTSQHVTINDLQSTVNAQTKRIIELNRRIGAILKALDGPLTVEQQARLQAELVARKQELAALTSTKRATVRQGQLAHVYLELRTRAAKRHVAVPPAKPGRIERKLDDAGRLLAVELAVLVYGLVVLAPFMLLGAGAVVAVRAQRRRTDRRLLAES